MSNDPGSIWQISSTNFGWIWDDRGFFTMAPKGTSFLLLGVKTSGGWVQSRILIEGFVMTILEPSPNQHSMMGYIRRMV